MGHSTFAYIRPYDGTTGGIRQAIDGLLNGDLGINEDSWTDLGGYGIHDAGSIHFKLRPNDISPELMLRYAKAIIRNCQAHAKQTEEGYKAGVAWKPYPWDDEEAKKFLFQHARKWEPGVAMPIDSSRVFIFGIAGG